jgi:hypothetical protein
MLYLGKVLDWIGQPVTGRSSITARIGGKGEAENRQKLVRRGVPQQGRPYLSLESTKVQMQAGDLLLRQVSFARSAIGPPATCLLVNALNSRVGGDGH